MVLRVTISIIYLENCFKAKYTREKILAFFVLKIRTSCEAKHFAKHAFREMFS